jgi:hypothetical protein
LPALTIAEPAEQPNFSTLMPPPADADSTSFRYSCRRPRNAL